MAEPRGVFVTGIPRSGTTLFASLLDALPGCTCLNEPQRYYEWTNTLATPDAFVRACLDDLARTAAALRNGEAIFDRRSRNGRIPTNYFSDTGERPPLWLVPIRRSNDTPLVAVKHNEPFVSVLDSLCRLTPGVPVIAIIRNPCDTLLSWRFTGIPLARGELSDGYRFWPAALALRDARLPLDEFHVRLYELYAVRLVENQDRLHLIRYEDLIEDPAIVGRSVGRQAADPVSLARRDGRRRTSGFLAWKSRLEPVLRAHFRAAFELYPEWDVL